MCGFPGGTSGKESSCQCRRCKRYSFNPWIGKIRWRRKWQLTSLFLTGKFHGHRNLVGHRPWGCKESDTTDYACIAQHRESVLEEIPSLLSITMPARNYLSTASATAKSLQLCPTLCDPIDGSPRGSPVPGILQARTLEWVAISFSNA